MEGCLEVKKKGLNLSEKLKSREMLPPIAILKISIIQEVYKIGFYDLDKGKCEDASLCWAVLVAWYGDSVRN